MFNLDATLYRYNFPARGRRFRSLIAIPLLWSARARQRRALENLDGHMLRDIGVGRVEAELEARKPFWRA